MEEYHYLSYGRPVGQNMKYLLIGQNERVLGGLCNLYVLVLNKSSILAIDAK